MFLSDYHQLICCFLRIFNVFSIFFMSIPFQQILFIQSVKLDICDHKMLINKLNLFNNCINIFSFVINASITLEQVWSD